MAAFDANSGEAGPIAGAIPWPSWIRGNIATCFSFRRCWNRPFPTIMRLGGIALSTAWRGGTGLAEDPQQLYALCEIFEVVRENTATICDADHLQVFENLPSEYLLSLHPSATGQADMAGSSGGAWPYGIDPNLASAQFVQGWAMEDPRVIREGPGIAFEFLWADPYLPGLSFYNLDPWATIRMPDLLYARTSWEPDSCWIRISAVRDESGAKGRRGRRELSGRLARKTLSRPGI